MDPQNGKWEDLFLSSSNWEQKVLRGLSSQLPLGFDEV